MLNKEDLMGMSLQRLRLVDVTNGEDEKVLQEVVSLKLSQMPPQMEVPRIDVPDIKTKEEELHWQKIIDERNAKLKPKVDENPIKAPELHPDVTPVAQEVLNACSLCDFVGKNANGLRLHQKKHTKVVV